MKTQIQNLFVALTFLTIVNRVVAQGTTAFTYQGQLHDGGTNANGAYTMTFKLYDAVTNGNQIGSAITNSPTLANGLFTVSLDFGAGPFTNGAARWLDITVTNGGTSQILSPRVSIAPVPYALYAMTPAGLQGPQGLTGATGSQGPQGLPGINGTNGVNGVNGTNGVSGTNSNVIGDWATTVGSDNGFSDLLTFSQNGSIRAIIAPTGDADGIGGDFGMEVFDNLHIEGNVSISSNLTANGSIHASDVYGGNLVYSSDRNLKEKFTPINPSEVLERVADLPISSWAFKANANTRHIGPMAQDFYAAFNVGTDDKHIATVDEGGVALAAIQGLNQKVTEQAAQMKEKDAQIEALNKRLADLEQLVKTSMQK